MIFSSARETWFDLITIRASSLKLNQSMLYDLGPAQKKEHISELPQPTLVVLSSAY